MSGHFDQNEKALDMILDKVAEDPSSGSCPNVSYADVNGPIASVNPTGSPFANTYNQQQQMQLSQMNNCEWNHNQPQSESSQNLNKMNWNHLK